MRVGGPVHEPDNVIAGAGPPPAAASQRLRTVHTGGTNPQKYGMDAVADLSDGVKSETNPLTLTP